MESSLCALDRLRQTPEGPKQKRLGGRLGTRRMRRCLSLGSLTSSPASAPGQEHTTVTSTQSSPSPNVAREFNSILMRNSFKQIRQRIESEVFDPNGNGPPPDQTQLVDGSAFGDYQMRFPESLLQPDRDSVRKGLSQLKTSDSETRLVSTFFDLSEAAVDLCIRLRQSFRCACTMYDPLRRLLRNRSFDSNNLTQSQCDKVSDIFSVFDAQENPFSPDDSLNLRQRRSSFSDLEEQLRPYVRESCSELRLLRRATTGSALCFTVTAVGVVTTAVVITIHALVAIVVVAGPISPVLSHFKNLKKKELARLAPLEEARASAYSLKHHLDSIKSLVDPLQVAVEADKNSVRDCLKMGKDRFVIQQTVKSLRERYERFRLLMEELEIAICISVNFVNRTRFNILDQICFHQNA